MKRTALVTERLYPPKKPPSVSLRKLAMGILRQAFRDAIPTGRSSEKGWRAWQQDAREWLFSDDTLPGSLNWVCEILRLEPWMIQKWLITYHKGDSARRRDMARSLFRSFRVH